MEMVTLVAVLVTSSYAILFAQDGEQYQVFQQDPKFKRVIDEIVTPLQSQKTVTVDATLVAPTLPFLPDINMNKIFQELQKSTETMKFFRVMREVFDVAYGTEKAETARNTILERVEARKTASDAELVQEVLSKTGVPATDPKFQEPTAHETVIVAQTEAGTIVPINESLGHIAEYASKHNKAKGFQRLIERLASVIETRKHSVEDVLRFLDGSDLPITDDGRIVGYKILRAECPPNKLPEHAKGKNKGWCIDKHSSSVPQRVGTRVSVNMELIDLNRRNECAAGLHVARRGYLGGFGNQTDKIFFVTVAPENVMVVPHGDPKKVRVSEYDIVAEIPKEFCQDLLHNKGIADNPAIQAILAPILAGNVWQHLETVKINAPNGQKLTVTNHMDSVAKVKKAKKAAKRVAGSVTEAEKKSVKTLKSNEERGKEDPTKRDIRERSRNAKPVVDPKTLSKATLSVSARAKVMVEAFISAKTASARLQAAQQLVNLRKTAKKSWTAIGVSENISRMVLSEVEDSKNRDKSRVGKPNKKTRADTIKELIAAGKYAEAVEIKKHSRKPWYELGLTKEEGADVEAKAKTEVR